MTNSQFCIRQRQQEQQQLRKLLTVGFVGSAAFHGFLAYALPSNSQVNRQALLAARQMQFSSPGDNAASVQVKIDFTVEGSEYDRLAREEQERKEQAARERHNLSGKLVIAIAIAFNIGLVNNYKAIAGTVEVSGGGTCEGDITANDLNGKVVCTYSNGDCDPRSLASL